MVVSTSLRSAPTTIVSSDFTPVMLGFQAYTSPSCTTWRDAWRRHEFTRLVGGRSALVVELPFVGETGLGVGGLRRGEDIAEPGARPGLGDEGGIYPCARLLLALQFLGQAARSAPGG